MAPPSASPPPRGARLAAYGLAAVAAGFAALLAAEVPAALADPATYEAVYHIGSSEGVYGSVGQYALACGLQALALGAVAVVAVVYARTGRWRRTVTGAAVALAALAAGRVAAWVATGGDH